MPRGPTGVHSYPVGYLAVDGEIALASQHNIVADDTSAAITESLPRTGTAGMLAALPMGGNKITGMADGTAATDAVTKGQLDTKAGLDAPAFTGNVTMAGALSVTGNISGAQGTFSAALNGVTAAFSGALSAASGAFSGFVSAVGAVTADGAAGLNKIFRLATGGVQRWDIATDAVAETGSNAGANLIINRYSDAGAFLGTPVSGNRATGVIDFATTPTIGGVPIVQISLTFGAVQSFIFGAHQVPGQNYQPGTDVSGSNILPTNSNNNTLGQSALSGTWRALGFAPQSSGTLWVRTI